VVGDERIAREAARLGATPRISGGLVDDFNRLAEDGFDLARLQPRIVDFLRAHRGTASGGVVAMAPGGLVVQLPAVRRLRPIVSNS
jgi:hypothetical protein